jgi:hypothetical protein
MGVLVPAAAEAAAGRRANRIAVEPFGHATGEGAGLGIGARQFAVELGDAGPLVEVRKPVLGRPAAMGWVQKGDDACLVPRQ